jgi:hypothetical protein
MTTPFAGETACAATGMVLACLGGAGFSLPTPACGRVLFGAARLVRIAG